MATTNFYLDTRRQRKDGTSQLKLSVNHRNGNRLLPSGINILPSQWDSERHEIVNHPLQARLNLSIQRMKLDVDEVLLTNDNISLDGLMTKTTLALFPEREQKKLQEKSRPTLIEVARRFRDMKTELSTFESYGCAIKHVENFCGDIALDDVTPGWLTELDAHMAATA